jgi:radical SAM superfamily enzyme YgiQ (UPF0313 family)
MKEMYGSLEKAGSSEIPYSLLMLAAIVREKGYSVKIIDPIITQQNNKETAKIINNLAPKVVGISIVTITAYYGAILAQNLKKKNSNIKIIVGGPHITSSAQVTFSKYPFFDVGVLGEGELTITELLDYFIHGIGELSKINGIGFYEQGTWRQTSPRALIQNLDALPLPAYDLFDGIGEKYRPPAWAFNQEKSALLITSRGCAGHCTFCDRSIFGNHCRAHGLEYLKKMVLTLVKAYHIRYLRINDDNFLIFRKRLQEFCDWIIEEKIPIKWSIFTRVDSIYEYDLILMKKAGCEQISLGIESGSQKIHNIEKKGIKIIQILQAIEKISKIGIHTVGFGIIGHPLESIQTLFQTMLVAINSKLNDFKVLFMVPYPGTELHSFHQKYGTLTNDWRKMNAYQNPCFLPFGLTQKELQKWRKKIFFRFYLRPRIFLQYLREIKSLTKLKSILMGFEAFIELIMKK